MTPRDTGTGGVLEAMILPALTRGGYAYETQKVIGPRCGGGRHVIDALAERDNKKYLVSLKWQQTGGTAEQKAPFEVMCLITEMRTGKYAAAYLVLGGDGWTLRDFYTSRGFKEHLTDGYLYVPIRTSAPVALMSIRRPNSEPSRTSSSWVITRACLFVSIVHGRRRPAASPRTTPKQCAQLLSANSSASIFVSGN